MDTTYAPRAYRVTVPDRATLVNDAPGRAYRTVYDYTASRDDLFRRVEVTVEGDPQIARCEPDAADAWLAEHGADHDPTRPYGPSYDADGYVTSLDVPSWAPAGLRDDMIAEDAVSMSDALPSVRSVDPSEIPQSWHADGRSAIKTAHGRRWLAGLDQATGRPVPDSPVTVYDADRNLLRVDAPDARDSRGRRRRPTQGAQPRADRAEMTPDERRKARQREAARAYRARKRILGNVQGSGLRNLSAEMADADA